MTRPTLERLQQTVGPDEPLPPMPVRPMLGPEDFAAYLAERAKKSRLCPVDRTSGLDGFLTAILIGPKFLDPRDWIASITGEAALSAPETTREHLAIQAIVAHHNRISTTLSETPDAYRPLFDRDPHLGIETTWWLVDRGETLRFIDIPVPAVDEFGIFAGAEDQAAANALAKAVEDTIAANHGLAFPAYLKELVPRADELGEQAKRHIEKFLARACPGGDAFERRLAGKFALVFAAAKIAAQLEAAPWTTSQSARAIMQIYRIARSSLDMPDPAYRDFLGKIDRGISESRFPRVEEKQSFPGGAEEPWGICRTHRGTGEIIAVFADTFDELCGSPMRRQRTIEELQKAGILWSPQSNTPKAQLMVSGLEASRKRFYCLRQGKLKSALRAVQ